MGNKPASLLCQTRRTSRRGRRRTRCLHEEPHHALLSSAAHCTGEIREGHNRTAHVAEVPKAAEAIVPFHPPDAQWGERVRTRTCPLVFNRAAFAGKVQAGARVQQHRRPGRTHNRPTSTH